MFRRLSRRLTAIVSHQRFEADMSDELRSHLEYRTDDLVATGLTIEDAARQARLEFGALEACKETCRDTRGFALARFTHGFWGDLRLAARRLRATPFFLLFAVLSLAVGVGITIASYAVIETLFWMPLGIPDPDRVVVIADPPTASAYIRHAATLTPHDVAELRSSQRALPQIAVATRFGATLVTPAGSDPISGEAVSDEYFPVVGTRAAIGRTIQAQDDDRAAPVMVLSDRLWRARFGADPNVVGRVVRLGGQPFEVVGVAPRDFDGILRGSGRPRPATAWMPLGAK